MSASAYRHRVIIENPLNGSQDAYGEAIETGAVEGFLWASKRELSGRELFEAQQINAEVTTEFRCRWRSDLDPKMRLRVDGKTYNIQSIVDPEGMRRELVILARRED